MTEEQFKVVVPARFESTRLPGKVLLEIAGKPMVQHVWERAVASGASDVIIATDSDQVAEKVSQFGAEVVLTSQDCQSGTDRVAEVCAALGWHSDVPVVNVQGDAPLIPPASIRNVAMLLARNPAADMATLCVALNSAAEYNDLNVVKVVFDRHGKALYFSRSPIPACGHGHDGRDGWRIARRHLGLYAYRSAALQLLSKTEPCELEKSERLEQLRALWLGLQIMVAVDENAHGPDVDTAADLGRVEAILAQSG